MMTRQSKKKKNMPPIEGVMTGQEAAKRLGVSSRTLDRWVRAGQVSRVKFGGRVYFTETHLNEYTNRCIQGERE